MLPDSAAESEARGLPLFGISGLVERSRSISTQRSSGIGESVRAQPAHRGLVSRFHALWPSSFRPGKYACGDVVFILTFPINNGQNKRFCSDFGPRLIITGLNDNRSGYG